MIYFVSHFDIYAHENKFQTQKMQSDVFERVIHTDIFLKDDDINVCMTCVVKVWKSTKLTVLSMTHKNR